MNKAISLILLIFYITACCFSCSKKKEEELPQEQPNVLPAGWQIVSSPQQKRMGYAAVLMADGKVLVTGGNIKTGSGVTAVNTCEVYDPVNDSWVSVQV